MSGERVKRQIERLLDECEQAFAERDWPQLARCARDALRLDSSSEEGAVFLRAAESGISDGPETVVPGSGGAERVRILNELMRIAISTSDINVVAGQVEEQIKKIVEFGKMVICINPAETDLIVPYFSHADLDPDDIRNAPPIRLDETTWGEVILTGQPCVIKDMTSPEASPLEQQFAERFGYRSALHVPLRNKDRVMGALSFGSRELDRYGDSDVAAAQEIADHIAVVVDHALLFARSRQLAVVEERARLARELHDALAQSLAGISISLEAAEKTMGDAPEPAREQIEAAREQAQSALAETRRSIWDLRPAALESGDLAGALQVEAMRASDERLGVTFTASGSDPHRLEPETELALLRIAQESLNNVRDHAGATSAEVALEYRPDDVRLRVRDDGKGFDPDSVGAMSAEGRGFGLASMQERARIVHGFLEVHSARGVGTEVDVVVPAAGSTEEVPVRPPVVTAVADPLDEAEQIRVLIVDDHEVVRRGLRQMLDQVTGIEIAGEAPDGESGARLVGSLDPDVVLLDVQMPGQDGVATLRQIREKSPETKVILLSVFAKDEQIFAGLRAGARGYMIKDAGVDDLTQAIRTVHGGGSLLPPLVADRLIARINGVEAPGLTPREQEVLERLATGAPNKQIAAELVLGTGTVSWHARNIYQKLNVSNRTEAVRIAREIGLLTD